MADAAEIDERLDVIATGLVDCVVEVRRELGAGLVESVYVACLLDELARRGITARGAVRVPLSYKGRALAKHFEIDVLVEDRIIVEAKAVEALHAAHVAQTLTYLKLSGHPLAFLVNFNAVPLRKGIHRFANTRK